MSTTSTAAPDDVCHDFAAVLATELDDIARARAAQRAIEDTELPDATGETNPYLRARVMDLHGLAFSGGGIRSATFNLGILQALCTLGRIGRFDYLSTVSGGGYIGSWLSALVRWRANNTRTAAELAAQLAVDESVPRKAGEAGVGKAREDRAISFLRAYSNYLTPRVGLLSIDTLAGISAYLRNLILVQTMILAGLVAVLLLPRLAYALAWRDLGHFDHIDLASVDVTAGAIAATALWTLSAVGVACNMHRSAPQWIQGLGFVWGAVMLPAVVGACLWALVLLNGLSATAAAPWYWPTWLAAFGAAVNTMSVLGFRARAAGALRRGAWMIAAGAIGGAVCGLGFDFAAWVMRGYGGTSAAHGLRLLVLTAGPPAVLQLASLGIVAYLGTLGRLLEYQTHEWWARYGALTIATSLAMGSACALSLYGPVLVEHLRALALLAGGSTWVLGTLWGLYKGASSTTKGEKASLTERAVRIVPFVSVLGLALLLSWATWYWASVAGRDDGASARPYLERGCAVETTLAPCLPTELRDFAENMVSSAALARLGPLFVGALALALVLAWRVDINLFSFHNFYRNRLTRCYLGSARIGIPPGTGEIERRANRFTGFDPLDDLPLTRLAGEDDGDGALPGDGKVNRPFHLVNTTLNMSSGAALAWQQRKAASFWFSPRHCGYQLAPTAEFSHSAGGFVAMGRYMRARGRDKGTMLGSVMAVSGAAASPNWGFHTSPAVAFVLTLFNIRLGRWCPNPGAARLPTRGSPAFGGMLLLKELFGAADANADYVYLSDGGHFDNLGLYELVRRRVGHIVVCDCGQDVGARFDDLADTLRKCYTDFGVEITLDVTPLKPVGEARVSATHCEKGTIKYPPLHGAQPAPGFTGTLLLIKPTLTEDLLHAAPDLRSYAEANAEFPQQTTADQWFDEAQFESYRKLGFLTGLAVFEDVPPPASAAGSSA